MSNEFSDELISAFLDGELSAAQQQQVEQMLVDNADYRRMFNELRGLRESLQTLPSYELDDQFAGRVLQRAERAMLTGPETTSESTELTSPHDRGNLRMAVTIVASVAALLFVSLFLLPNVDAPVAVTNERDSDATSAENSNRSLNESHPSASEAKGLESPEGDYEESAHEDSPFEALAEQAEPFGDKGADSSSASSVTRQSKARKQDEFSNDDSAVDLIGQADRQGTQLKRTNGNQIRAPKAPFKDSAADRDENGKPRDLVRTDTPSVQRGAVSSTPATSPAPKPTAPSLVAQDQTKKMAAPTSGPNLNARYVATLDVSRTAFERGLFDQALMANGIKVVTPDHRQGPRLAAESPAQDKHTVIDLRAADSLELQSTLDGTSRALKAAQVTDAVDVVFVEASMDQIASTLNTLQSNGLLLSRGVYREPFVANVPGDFAKYQQVPYEELARRRQAGHNVAQRAMESANKALLKDESAGADAKQATPGKPVAPTPQPDDGTPKVHADEADDAENLDQANERERTKKPFARKTEESQKANTSTATPSNLANTNGVNSEAKKSGFAVRVPQPTASAPSDSTAAPGGAEEEATDAAPQSDDKVDESSNKPRREAEEKKPNRDSDDFSSDTVPATEAAKQTDLVRIVLVIRAIPKLAEPPVEAAAEAAVESAPADKQN